MKRRREWKVILLGLAVVGFLFLLSSTDLFFEEEREEIYTISVIQDENDSRYQIYRKGIDVYKRQASERSPNWEKSILQMPQSGENCISTGDSGNRRQCLS